MHHLPAIGRLFHLSPTHGIRFRIKHREDENEKADQANKDLLELAAAVRGAHRVRHRSFWHAAPFAVAVLESGGGERHWPREWDFEGHLPPLRLGFSLFARRRSQRFSPVSSPVFCLRSCWWRGCIFFYEIYRLPGPFWATASSASLPGWRVPW